MKSVFRYRVWFALFALSSFLVPTVNAEEPDGQWLTWRGPQNSGASSTANPPTQWSTEKNVRWKAELPGKGSSTPIVVDGKVIVLTAVKTDRVQEKSDAVAPAGRGAGRDPDGGGNGPGRGGPGGRGGQRGGGGNRELPMNYYKFMVLAFDQKTGSKLWETVATEQVPHEAGHGTNNFASFSPATDGKNLYVFFGSRGVFAFDLQGKKLWEKDLGDMITRNQFGEGGSPAVSGDKLIVPWDNEQNSFIAALDTKSGEVVWKTDRQEATGWATPLIVPYKGTTQVITNGKKVRSYDLSNGQLIWECGGQTDNPIPTPILFGDHVIATTGFRGANAYSISLDSKGDVTKDTKMVAWKHDAGTPYVPSPTLYKNRVYFVKSNNGVLTALDATTGKVLIDQERIEGIQMIYSSLGAAADKVYAIGRDGTTVVMKASDKLEIIATNQLNEEIDASPVFIGSDLYLRGEKHLFCLSESTGQ